MKIIYIILASILLYGCQAENMSHFEERQPRIMTDHAGSCYVVEHHIGNLYTVKPLKGVDCDE